MNFQFKTFFFLVLGLMFLSSTILARGEFCKQSGACISLDSCVSTLVNNIDYEKDFAWRLCNFETEFEQWDIIRKTGYIEHVVDQTPYYSDEIYYMSAVHALLFAYDKMQLPEANRFDKCVRKFHDQTKISILRAHDNCEILATNWPEPKEEELLNCTLKREQTLNEKPDDAFNTCIEEVFPQQQ